MANGCPQRLPGWQVMALGYLCRFVHGSGFCIQGHSGKYLLWSLTDDGTREGGRLYHLRRHARTSEQHQLHIDHARSYRRFGDSIPERTVLLEELQEHDPKPWL